MQPTQTRPAFNIPRPGKALIALMVANLVLYILQLFLLRLDQTWIRHLYLSSEEVLTKGFVWQIFTYGWFHAPEATGHLLWNMVMLWLFGAPMEQFWGPKRFVKGYFIFILGGGLLTVAYGGLMLGLHSAGVIDAPHLAPHLGASGGVLGVAIAWGLVHAKNRFNFMFVFPMTGMTMVWLFVGLELLRSLSYENVSSTGHFGGMATAFILCKGLWRPSNWKKIFRDRDLKRQRAAIEKELQVLQGGKGHPSDNPKDWN